MCDRDQVERKVWRLIVLRRNASEFLVFETKSGFHLPCVEIPAHSRVAEALNAEVKALWDLDVFSLYALPAKTPIFRYHVIEALQHEALAPPAAQWIPVASLTAARFAEFDEFAAVKTWVEHIAGRNSDTDDPTFDKPGCFLILKAWVQEALRPFELTLTGGFVQLHAGPSFSLIRFETDGDAVWFKAVGEPNKREFPLTVTLSSLLSEYTPRVLATQPLWNAWLMLEVPGLRLRGTDNLTAWSHAARDLARMQIASVGMTETILSCQARDLRMDTLLRKVEPFFTRLSGWMECQAKSPPVRLLPQEIAQVEEGIREALLTLQQQSLPDSLGHLDLNPENIIQLPERTVFLDWAEASVGHPFFSLAYLLEHFRRAFARNAEGQSRLIAEYAGVWQARHPIENFDRIVSLSAFAAVFAHAVSTDVWRDDGKLQETRIAGYYRSLGRRMKCYRDRIDARVSNVSGVVA